MYRLQNIDIPLFVSDYWQQKPLLIKQGFEHFVDPIDEHTLAGLAQEPEVDARLISCEAEKWHVEHAPFEDINQRCKGAWSLLVQSVDHYVPEADQLLRSFDFLPHWRLDDLMVSFSNENAGVGAHLDQYDVFIIQGKGRRRWQVGLPGDYPTLTPHQDLRQIAGFEPVIDEVLSAGDVLYIPANHPHNGVALGECLNYSVGFRAPSQQELLSSFADYAIENELLSTRYTDPSSSVQASPHQLTGEQLQQFKSLLHQAVDSDSFERWLPQFLSVHVSHNGEFEPPTADDEITPEALEQALVSGHSLHRELGIKPIRYQSECDSQVVFAVEGDLYPCPKSEEDLVQQLLFADSFVLDEEKNSQLSASFLKLVSTLVNSGYWYLE